MRLLPLVTLLFTLIGALHAATVSKDIIVGAFGTPKQAQFRNAKLEAYLGHDPAVAELLKQKHFYFDVKFGNGNYRSVLTHFLNEDERLTVFNSVKRIFPDAYMLPTDESGIPPIYTASAEKPVQAPTKTPKPAAPAVTTPPAKKAVVAQPLASVTPAASKPAAEAPVEDIVVIDQPEAPSEPAAVAEAEVVIAPDGEAAVAEVIAVEETAPEAETPYLLYGIVLAILVLAVLFFMARRKKPSNRVLKTPEMINLEQTEAPTAKPTETPVAPVEEIVEEVPAAPVVEPEPQEPSVAVFIEEEEEAPAPIPEPAAAPATSPRKKRSLPAHLEGITKESLTEFAGNRILVAEDNLINQKVITKLLEDSGIELVMANNGQEAIDMLSADPTYSMVLMDAHMPVKDGFEATREIRRNILFEPITVVALSGDVSSDDIRKMREAGMEEQLAKPLRIEELYKVFYQYLDFADGDEGETDDGLPELKTHEDAGPLNSAEGLEVCGGDKEMYVEILDEFVETYSNADTLVDAYLRADDDGKLVALMLDIKGVAANIGADPLSEAAETLREAVLINQTTAYESLAKEFDTELRKAITAIESFKNAR